MSNTLNEEKRELAAKVVDRILSDPTFRDALRMNPEAAINSTFAEEWNSLLESQKDPEVAGYLAGGVDPIEGDSTVCCTYSACEITNY